MSITKILAIISIPILMLSDYFFTLLGKKLRDNVYVQHMSSEQYELNPGWQDDINKMKKLNYKHILAVILVTGYFYFTALLISDLWFDIIYGALFAMYFYIIMRHTNNILIYKFANKNPELLSGKVVIGHIFSLKVSQYQIFTSSVFLLFIFIWSRSWFVLGGAIGLFILMLTQIKWIRTYKRKLKLKSLTQQTAAAETQLPS